MLASFSLTEVRCFELLCSRLTFNRSCFVWQTNAIMGELHFVEFLCAAVKEGADNTVPFRCSEFQLPSATINMVSDQGGWDLEVTTSRGNHIGCAFIKGTESQLE